MKDDKMTYAVSLGFDVESTEKTRKKIIEITESNINSYMVDNNITPHLIISFFQTDNEFNAHEVFKYICLKVPRKLVQICSIGTFEPSLFSITISLILKLDTLLIYDTTSQLKFSVSRYSKVYHFKALPHKSFKKPSSTTLH